MLLTIANRVTGEVVETDTVKGLNQMRGVIRDWMRNNGLSLNDFRILASSDYKLSAFIRDYAWQHAINECDICKAPVLNRDLKFLDDSEGVCLMVACEDCM
jgi:hypothetical protein